MNVTFDYLSWFGMVLRGIYRNVKMCFTKYSIPSKLILNIFPLFWSHTQKYNIQVNERLTKVKEKW